MAGDPDNKRVKTEDKWHIYAMMGENDDLRMDGHEPERDCDHLVDQFESDEPSLCAAEKSFYEQYGYEPTENPRSPTLWPTRQKDSFPVRVAYGARWRVLASDLPALIGTLFESTTCNTLSFETVCQTLDGVTVLELTFLDSGFEMLSFHSFNWKNLGYWLKAVEGKRFRLECLRGTGDIWFSDPRSGDPIHLGRMLALPGA